MRWLIVLPFDRPEHMGIDFRDELVAMGHEVRTFAYRRDNPLYKNKSTKAAYQIWILRRLERACLEWWPACVLVIKGGPITPGLIRRVKARIDTRFVNFFPDNPLLMIPFECIEAYDLFLTKERYAVRTLESAGLRNLHYMPLYCVPEFHHPATLTPDDARRFTTPVSLVGSWYPYRERFLASLGDYPIRVWGNGWERAETPAVRAMVAGGPVWGHAKLAIYSASTLSLNPHHPLNDIVGVNTRAFELAAAGACQIVDLKEELAALFTPGEEVITYRDHDELRRQIDYYLAHADEARAIGHNAQRRALKEHTLRHRIDEMLYLLERRAGPSA
ncbi:MAG TPA: glycosyltransferase [Methylomirabilota bacterium]|jgi:spore maturation protein CgeB|nr:glycosyltransferase [Methylomirabilota bacterium]